MVSKIRHITTCDNSKYFLAAEFEKVVHVFQKGIKNKLISINTHLDFGGKRLQLFPDNDLIIAGAFSRYGIEAYSIITGELLWKRPDLKKLQYLQRHPKTNYLSCFFDGVSGQMMDSITGETISKYRGIKKIYFNKTEDFCL